MMNGICQVNIILFILTLWRTALHINNIKKMQIQNANDLVINNIESINQNNTKKSFHILNSSRNLIKQFLTKQILQECLETLDLFREIMEDHTQKKKLIRDVLKNIQLKLYDLQGIIYNKGEISQSIYMTIKGSVSLCMPVIKETQPNNGIANTGGVQYDYQEIDVFGEGIGFGEGDFIHKRKRGLVAIAKQDKTVVGVLDGSAFAEIIELYKQRVYYKKIEMFSKCPLLKNIHPYQLEFIVNNAKPIVFSISKEIVKTGQIPKSILLITGGKVELRRQGIKIRESNSKNSRNYSKMKNQQENSNLIKIRSIVVGMLQEGQFLGDCELALHSSFSFTATCKSQKVKAYICDDRIITSQMNEEAFQAAKKYYQCKIQYREKKLDVYKDAKLNLQNQLLSFQKIILSEDQIRMKRKINNRYVEKIPTLIGQLSPREISKIIDKKYIRFQTQFKLNNITEQSVSLPNIKFNSSPVKKIIRNQQAFSPLLKKSQEKPSRKMTDPGLYGSPEYSYVQSISYPSRKQQIIQLSEFRQLRSKTRPLLVFMKPFHKKMKSIHQRINESHGKLSNKQKDEMHHIKIHHDQHQLSGGEMKRLAQFIKKLQVQSKLKN